MSIFFIRAVCTDHSSNNSHSLDFETMMCLFRKVQNKASLGASNSLMECVL